MVPRSKTQKPQRGDRKEGEAGPMWSHVQRGARTAVSKDGQSWVVQ